MNTNIKVSAICLIGTCGLFVTAAYITDKYVSAKQEVNIPVCEPVNDNPYINDEIVDRYGEERLQQFVDVFNHKTDLKRNFNDTTHIKSKKHLRPVPYNPANRSHRVLTGNDLLDAGVFPELYNSDGTSKVIVRKAPTYDELKSKSNSLEYDLDKANDKIDELESKIAELESEINN